MRFLSSFRVFGSYYFGIFIPFSPNFRNFAGINFREWLILDFAGFNFREFGQFAKISSARKLIPAKINCNKPALQWFVEYDLLIKDLKENKRFMDIGPTMAKCGGGSIFFKIY